MRIANKANHGYGENGMYLNIAQKIFGIAAVVLVLMVAVAIHSIELTAGISESLRTIAVRDLPTSQAVGRINIQVLNQGVLLQRLFVLSGDEDEDAKVIVQDKVRYRSLGTQVTRAFDQTGGLLNKMGERRLIKHLDKIENEYMAFEVHGWKMVAAREAQDGEAFEKLLPILDTHQDSINQEITKLHKSMSALTDQAVQNADRAERRLLLVNSALTVIAALLALVFATVVTRLLVRAVHDLVRGAQSVEAGNLDTEVVVSTHDEIGTLATSFNEMVGGLRLKERIKETFGKYMDPRIVAGLLDHPEFSQPGGEKREMSVMFIDLKGFTSISEVLQPDDLIYLVNDFFGHMSDAISNHKGVVDKYMGDAVMAYWGPPFCDGADHARLACEAAREALGRLEHFRADVHKKLGADADGLDIDLRIGVSSGEMIVGTIGSKISRNFTVMGDPVNLGSRLEGANKAYGTRILVSDRTHRLAGKDMPMREIDMIRVKGKQKPVRVYEVLNASADIDNLAVGLKAYRSQHWDDAQTAFAKIGDDVVAQVYLDRITQLRETPPPPDWDGVWVFETK